LCNGSIDWINSGTLCLNGGVYETKETESFDIYFFFVPIIFQVAHLYTKQRKEFGKHCNFTAAPASVLEAIPVVESYQENYIMRNPSVTCFDTSPHM